MEFSEEEQCIRKSGIIATAKQYSNKIIVKKVYHMTSKEFMEAESLGVEPPRRCSEYRGCQKCSFRGQKHTERESPKYKMIKSGVKYTEEKGYFDVAYVWVHDPAKLHNNIGQAIKIAENEERGRRTSSSSALPSMPSAGGEGNPRGLT